MSRNANATQRRSAFRAAPTVPATPKERLGRTRTTETPLHIKTFGLSADEPAREYMRKHLGFKLGKFALAITSLDVHVRHESGPKGEPVVTCGLTLWLAPGGAVVVERSASKVLVAFDLALDVGERTIRRTLDRIRVRTRRGAPA